MTWCVAIVARTPRLPKSIYALMEIHRAIDLSDGCLRDMERMMATLGSIAKYRTLFLITQFCMHFMPNSY